MKNEIPTVRVFTVNIVSVNSKIRLQTTDEEVTVILCMLGRNYYEVTYDLRKCYLSQSVETIASIRTLVRIAYCIY